MQTMKQQQTNQQPVRIGMIGSGFVAEFYMQGLANVNGHVVAGAIRAMGPGRRPLRLAGALPLRAATWMRLSPAKILICS